MAVFDLSFIKMEERQLLGIEKPFYKQLNIGDPKIHKRVSKTKTSIDDTRFKIASCQHKLKV